MSVGSGIEIWGSRFMAAAGHNKLSWQWCMRAGEHGDPSVVRLDASCFIWLLLGSVRQLNNEILLTDFCFPLFSFHVCFLKLLIPRPILMPTNCPWKMLSLMRTTGWCGEGVCVCARVFMRVCVGVWQGMDAGCGCLHLWCVLCIVCVGGWFWVIWGSWKWELLKYLSTYLSIK